MRYENGFPYCEGASDLADSPVINALMIMFNVGNYIHPLWYFVNGHPVRYPYGKTISETSPFCFSRDQNTMLAAAEFYHPVIKPRIKPTWFAPNFVNEEQMKWQIPDPHFPGVYNHLRICYGLKPIKLFNIWFWLEIFYSCYIKPLAEPNQLIAMMMCHPNKKYLKYWLKNNKQWEKAIKDYWCEGPGSWRGEPELAHAMIEKLRTYAKP